MALKAQILGSEYDGEYVEVVGPVMYMHKTHNLDYSFTTECIPPIPTADPNWRFNLERGADGEYYYVVIS